MKKSTERGRESDRSSRARSLLRSAVVKPGMRQSSARAFLDPAEVIAEARANQPRLRRIETPNRAGRGKSNQ
jgi:hypothetical protein